MSHENLQNTKNKQLPYFQYFTLFAQIGLALAITGGAQAATEGKMREMGSKLLKASWVGRIRSLCQKSAATTLLVIATLTGVSSAIPLQAQVATCGSTVLDLTAGQTILVGSVTTSNDMSNLYVTYSLTSASAAFGKLHLWIGNDILNVPANKQGTPVPGQFPYQADATGLTSYTFTVPFTSLLYQDANAACGATLNVVAHAEVYTDYLGDPSTHETAFAGPIAGGGNRWWFYGTYVVCCDFGPPVVSTCNTAFAKAGYVFTTDRKSNPERLPSLNLTRNRWGWAAKLTSPGTFTYPLYAGAGLNDITKGTNVGNVVAAWDGSTVTVTYTITATGYFFKEGHIYAGDGAPTTIAPGQYGNTAYLFGYEKTFTMTAPLVDSDANGVWLVAHAVVCN